MRILITAMTAVFLCLPANAETYLRGMGGTGFDWSYKHNDFTIETRNGYFVAGAVGTEFAEYGDLSFAVEGEVTYLRSPVDNSKADSDLSSVGFLANGLVRYDPGGNIPVRPYAGAGLGLAVNSFQFEGPDTGSMADPGLAWQVIAGTNFKLNRFLSLDVQYRFLGQDLLSVGDKIENDHFEEPRQHAVMAGITMCFQKCWDYW